MTIAVTIPETIPGGAVRGQTIGSGVGRWYRARWGIRGSAATMPGSEPISVFRHRIDFAYDEACALAIVNLYRDKREEKRDQAIPNKTKTSLGRVGWKKRGICIHIPHPHVRTRVDCTWLLDINPT